MSFIQFTDSEIVNIDLIDSQHKNIVELLNNLHDELGAKYEGRSKRLLEDFKKTLTEHFDTEESLMKEHEYLSYYSHKLEHDRFINKVNNYLLDIQNEINKLDLVFLQSARRWFYNHLELKDKKCAEFLLSKGYS